MFMINKDKPAEKVKKSRGAGWTQRCVSFCSLPGSNGVKHRRFAGLYQMPLSRFMSRKSMCKRNPS